MNSFVSPSPSWVTRRPSLVMAHVPGPSTLKKPPVPQHPDIPVDDWDMLFRAVRARLRSTVGGAVTADNVNVTSVPGTQDAVLDCVAALECLHTALTYERSETRHGFFHAD